MADIFDVIADATRRDLLTRLLELSQAPAGETAKRAARPPARPGGRQKRYDR